MGNVYDGLRLFTARHRSGKGDDAVDWSHHLVGHRRGERVEELVFRFHLFYLNELGHVTDRQHLALPALEHQAAVAQPKKLFLFVFAVCTVRHRILNLDQVLLALPEIFRVLHELKQRTVNKPRLLVALTCAEQT